MQNCMQICVVFAGNLCDIIMLRLVPCNAVALAALAAYRAVGGMDDFGTPVELVAFDGIFAYAYTGCMGKQQLQKLFSVVAPAE